MTSEPRRSFFQGAEFSRLLVLASMMLIGIPLVIYYGYYREQPQRASKTPIAQLPPLPPADDSPEFAPVRDDTSRSFRDDDAMAMLFRRVREDRAQGLAKAARTEVSPEDLILRPKRYRGLPIRLEGYAWLVSAVDDNDRDLVPNGRLYEICFYQDQDDQKLPCLLLAESVPPTLPGGRNLNERIAVEGYFLKLQKFQGANRTFYHAPLLIGRVTHDTIGPGGPGSGPRSRAWTFAPIVLLVLYLGMRMFFTLRKTLAPKAAIKTVRSSSIYSDRIEAQDLDRWVAGEGDREAAERPDSSWEEPPSKV